MTDTAPALLHAWVTEPHNTARSVLVTIFGDTILPTNTSIWLNQLFQLTDVFGFSQRLVRTSMFRLAAEGWFTSERVGRQSRYSLTPLAIEESEQAATRIYASADPNWSGTWTVAFLDSPTLSAGESDQLEQHLRWHGFITLSKTVLGSPICSTTTAIELARLIDPDIRLPLASLEFNDIESLVATGFFDQALAIGALEKSYGEFVELYEPITASLQGCTSADAFALRTMLIHDLRRIRLRGPDIPAALLPADWVGNTADVIATQLYQQLSATASGALSEILDTSYPTTFADRFPDRG